MLTTARVSILSLFYYKYNEMEPLDDDVRLEIEGQIDEIFDDPQWWEANLKDWLRSFGIQPDLDDVMSAIMGFTLGQAHTLIHEKFDRGWTPEEAKAIMKVLVRRAFELRRLFLEQRIEE